MKRTVLLVAVITALSTLYARSAPLKALPGYGDSVMAAIPAAPDMLADIMNVVGLKTNFELKEADVQNIQACISRKKKRRILYNPSYISWINKTTGDKWAAMVLVAHEVGHHLNGHTMQKGGSKPAIELEADEFAGFVLYKLGATLEEAQKVMKYIARPEASDTHPGREARMEAIAKGWKRAGGKV